MPVALVMVSARLQSILELISPVTAGRVSKHKHLDQDSSCSGQFCRGRHSNRPYACLATSGKSFHVLIAKHGGLQVSAYAVKQVNKALRTCMQLPGLEPGSQAASGIRIRQLYNDAILGHKSMTCTCIIKLALNLGHMAEPDLESGTINSQNVSLHPD